MTLFKSPRMGKDLDFIKNISEKIDKKLSQSLSTPSIDNMTVEELQDLGKISRLANFMLTKYEDKKEVHSILKYFVSIISESSQAIEKIDDEVSELIISAEDSISKIKEVHTNISEKYDVGNHQTSYDGSESYLEDFEKVVNNESENVIDLDSENSSINLTKIAIEINSQEYQENSTKKSIQVI